MRARLGIPDQDVFGGSGLSLRKAQLELKSSVTKLTDAINFFGLGIKMLGTDIGYAGSLFGRAALGNTLKPREVSVRPLLPGIVSSLALFPSNHTSTITKLACGATVSKPVDVCAYRLLE